MERKQELFNASFLQGILYKMPCKHVLPCWLEPLCQSASKRLASSLPCFNEIRFLSIKAEMPLSIKVGRSQAPFALSPLAQPATNLACLWEVLDADGGSPELSHPLPGRPASFTQLGEPAAHAVLAGAT